MKLLVHGLPLRQPVARFGAWITDGVLVAHQSLTVFGAIHSVLHGDGLHEFDEGEWTRLEDLPGDVIESIPQFLAGVLDPAVIVDRVRQQAYPIATQMPPEAHWWVIDDHGAWLYDGRIAQAAEVGIPGGLSWHTWHYRGRSLLAGSRLEERVFALSPYGRIREEPGHG